MAYADQPMSGNRITAMIIVALLHVVLGYALVTGLAYDAVKKAVQRVTTVDIKEEVKKEPPPPPKKLDLPPPPTKVIAPPPKISMAPPAPFQVAPPPPQPEPAPPPPPPPQIKEAPPPPRFTPKGATPKGSGQGSWVTDADYPSRALREEREGVTGYRLTLGPDGKVTDCSITSSSGSPDLDEAVCSNLRRRARFNPAMDGDGNPTTGSYSARVRWKIPKE
jgi:periplasmic protein TonB